MRKNWKQKAFLCVVTAAMLLSGCGSAKKDAATASDASVKTEASTEKETTEQTTESKTT